MKLFHFGIRDRDVESRKIYARYELAYTLADFAAAICFVAGSVMFFDESLIAGATWFFVIGSLLFALKPTLRLSREIHLYRMGNLSDLAKRAE